MWIYREQYFCSLHDSIKPTRFVLNQVFTRQNLTKDQKLYEILLSSFEITSKRVSQLESIHHYAKNAESVHDANPCLYSFSGPNPTWSLFGTVHHHQSGWLSLEAPIFVTNLRAAITPIKSRIYASRGSLTMWIAKIRPQNINRRSARWFVETRTESIECMCILVPTKSYCVDEIWYFGHSLRRLFCRCFFGKVLLW